MHSGFAPPQHAPQDRLQRLSALSLRGPEWARPETALRLTQGLTFVMFSVMRHHQNPHSTDEKTEAQQGCAGSRMLLTSIPPSGLSHASHWQRQASCRSHTPMEVRDRAAGRRGEMSKGEGAQHTLSDADVSTHEHTHRHEHRYMGTRAHTRAQVTLSNPPQDKSPGGAALDSARAGWRASTSLPTRPCRRPGRGAPCVSTSLPASCSAAQVLLGAGQAQLLGQTTGVSGTTCRQALPSGHGTRPCLSQNFCRISQTNSLTSSHLDAGNRW